MNKEVIINISGLQLDAGTGRTYRADDDRGLLSEKTESTHVIYDELTDDSQVVKPFQDQPEGRIDKKEASSSHMVRSGEKKTSLIMTLLFGSLLLGINTSKIDLEEKEDSMALAIDYGLSINSDHVSDCSIDVSIASKQQEHSECTDSAQ